MTKFVIALIVIAVVGIGFFFLLGKRETPSNLATVQEKTSESDSMMKDEMMKKGESISLNQDASTLRWSARKIAGQTNHTGTVEVKDGTVSAENGELLSGTVTIDMTTIKDEDIENETMNQKLITHLESDDFFSVQNFPEATFVITNVSRTSDENGNTHQLTGDLTIKGNTNQITFPAKIVSEGEKLIADANFSINRADWDIRFGSNTFFENLGDNAIDDYITFEVHLET